MDALDPRRPFRSPWLYDCKPFHMVDNVYYVGNTSVSSHLFDTGEGLLLLDTGYMETGYLMLEAIRELGFDPKDIKWILHSHAHIDHFGATRMLVEKYGCKTYMPAADVCMMDEKKELLWTKEFAIHYDPPYDTWFKVDHAIQIGEILTFGNIKMTAYDAGGHTPGTMAYVFELPSGLKAAMHGGIGLNTLTSAYSRRFGLGTSWREAYAASLDRLEDLQVDVVLGNHPKQSKTFEKLELNADGTNHFIDPDEWKQFIRTTRETYIKTMAKDPIE